VRLAREAGAVFTFGVALAAAMTWPLAANLGRDLPQDLGDPLHLSWQLAWIGHALIEHPQSLFQANTFWPLEDSLAFSDVLLGYAPAGLLAASGPGQALAAYNLAFLFAYALATLGAYLLARELGLSRAGALVAGIAFAYAPYRLAQDGHLHVISSGGIPLTLFLLVRGYRRTSAPFVIAGWAVATWQVTLGFTLGVPLAYLLFALGIVALVYAFRRKRAHLGRPVVAATLAGGSLFTVVTLLQARPFRRVLEAHPEAERTRELVELYSPPARSFLAASQDSFLWSGATKNVWDSLSVPGEQALFPGIAILLLACIGVAAAVYPLALRVGLAAGTALCALLSLGLRDEEHFTRGLTPYRLLYELGPGWDALRAPGRVHTLTSLGLALLAGAGGVAIVRAVQSRPLTGKGVTSMQRTRAGVVAGTVLIGLVLVEGLGPTQHPAVPSPPAPVSAPAPQLHLPFGGLEDVLYAYWSIDGFAPIANGYASITPNEIRRLRRQALRFPDATSTRALRELGIRTVILHRDLAQGTAWASTAQRPTGALRLVREERPGLTLYHLTST
jgi:hypothetical protein